MRVHEYESPGHSLTMDQGNLKRFSGGGLEGGRVEEEGDDKGECAGKQLAS